MDKLEIVKSKITPLRITEIVQTGFVNIPLTNILAEKGCVTLYSPMTFDPFKDNDKVCLITETVATGRYSDFRDLKVDVLYLGHCEDYHGTKIGISMWGPKIRFNGYIFIGKNNEEIKLAVEQYTAIVGEEFFEVEYFDDPISIRLKR